MKTLEYRHFLNRRAIVVIPLLCLLLLPFSFYLAGCGGGGGGNSAPVTSGTLSVPVNWPARNRATISGAPLATESVRVSALRADGSVVTTQTMNRPALAMGGSDTKVITLAALPLETLNITLEAFAAPDGSGASLGKATKSVTFSASQGNGNIAFAVESPVARLVINLPSGRVSQMSGANGIPVGKVTTTAYDAADNIVPVRPETLTYTVDRGSVADEGTLYASSSGDVTVSVSERESQLSAQATVTVGTPVALNIGVGGTDAQVPITPSIADDSAPNPYPFYVDPTLLPIVLDNNPIRVQWSKGEVLQGKPFTLTAPATYGDLRFAGWQSAGGGLRAAPGLMIDPIATATNQLTATYTKRSPDAQGEFTPNYVHESNGITYTPPLPNVVVFWNLSDSRIAFVNAEDFTPERKEAAIKGFNWWIRASGGRFRYTLLNDDDTDNANIIVAFTTNLISPRVQQETYIPGAGNDLPPRNGGITSSQSQSVDGHYIGGTKRVILISAQKPEEITGVAAHELCHAYGMGGHSARIGDVMYPRGSGQDFNFPSERDINSLLTILELSKKANVTRAQRGGPAVTGGKLITQRIP